MSSSPKSEKPSTTSEIERVFRVLDADGDGKISETELETVVRALGSPTSPEEVRTMIDEMDADRNGIVDIKDFSDFNSYVADGGGEESTEWEAELRVAFDMYDVDHNGLISAKEIHQVLKNLGDKSSVQDCARMIGSVDSNGDGNVNFEEFKKMMSRGVKKASDLSPTPNPTPTPPSSSQ